MQTRTFENIIVVSQRIIYCLFSRIYKEAVRQRQALTRTSSNIILNSIHQHRIQHYSHRLRPPDSENMSNGNGEFFYSFIFFIIITR